MIYLYIDIVLSLNAYIVLSLNAYIVLSLNVYIVLSLNVYIGNHVEASVGFKLLQLISRSAELQPYAVHKLFFCLRDGSANNPVLAKVKLTLNPKP